MTDDKPTYLEVGPAGAVRRIALLRDRPAAPSRAGGVIWLQGLKSEMTSTKATAIAEWAARERIACTRFDYSGHGRSDGRFEDGTVGAWLDEAEAIFRTETEGPQVLVGSSTGGYVALLLLRRLLAEDPTAAARVRALVLVAPAWDMTERLMWQRFPESARRATAPPRPACRAVLRSWPTTPPRGNSSAPPRAWRGRGRIQSTSAATSRPIP